MHRTYAYFREYTFQKAGALNINKEREKKILEMVFDTNDFQITDNGMNQPDYILTYPLSNTTAGVEITELYLNNSMARLINKNGYFNNIMANNAFIHKDDKMLLKPNDYFKVNKDGSDGEQIQGMLIPYTIEDYKKTLLESIQKKNDKYTKLTMPFNYSILCIYDFENCLSIHDKEEFNNLIIDKQISSVIINSCFDEIYLVTRFLDGCFYTGLKLLLITTHTFQLGYYLNSNKQKLLNEDFSFVDTLSELFTLKGYPNISKGLINNNKVVNICFYSIGIDANNRNTIFKRYPYQPPMQAYSDNPTRFFKDDEFIEFEKIYEKDTIAVDCWTKVSEKGE